MQIGDRQQFLSQQQKTLDYKEEMEKMMFAAGKTVI